jgi:hypothetical protein
VGVYVLGYCGNNSQKVSYLYIQVLVYRLERAKTTSGRPLSTKNSKARKSGEKKREKRIENHKKNASMNFQRVAFNSFHLQIGCLITDLYFLPADLDINLSCWLRGW